MSIYRSMPPTSYLLPTTCLEKYRPKHFHYCIKYCQMYVLPASIIPFSNLPWPIPTLPIRYISIRTPPVNLYLQSQSHIINHQPIINLSVIKKRSSLVSLAPTTVSQALHELARSCPILSCPILFNPVRVLHYPFSEYRVD